MTRTASAILVGAALAPLVTWLPMLAHYAPWTGLPPYHPSHGIDLWSMQTYWFVALAIVASLVVSQDRLLALVIFFAGFELFWRGARMDPTHSVLFAFGALGLWAVRRAPASFGPRVIAVLSAIGLFQTAYIIQQHLFQYDVLWMIWGNPRVPVVQPLGTLGTVDAATGYVALTAPLMPVWALPFAIYAVWCGKSLGALTALVVGLVVRGLLARRTILLAAGAVSFIPFAIIAYYKVWIGTATVNARLTVQWLAAKHAALTAPVFGLGLGGWATQIPALQMERKVLPSGEVFMQAHSEPVQWLVETGVFGAVLLALWLWTHRTMFAHPRVGASLSALAVSALGFFPFHVVATAFAGILLVGIATPHEPAAEGGA